MSTQLGHVYNVNRHSPNPVKLLCTPLNGKLKERMDGAGTGQHMRWKGITFSEKPLNALWTGKEPEIEQDKVVYLTADSPNLLSSLEVGETYIIGGIVDHNRYKVSLFAVHGGESSSASGRISALTTLYGRTSGMLPCQSASI